MQVTTIATVGQVNASMQMLNVTVQSDMKAMPIDVDIAPMAELTLRSRCIVTLMTCTDG